MTFMYIVVMTFHLRTYLFRSSDVLLRSLVFCTNTPLWLKGGYFKQFIYVTTKISDVVLGVVKISDGWSFSSHQRLLPFTFSYLTLALLTQTADTPNRKHINTLYSILQGQYPKGFNLNHTIKSYKRSLCFDTPPRMESDVELDTLYLTSSNSDDTFKLKPDKRYNKQN